MRDAVAGPVAWRPEELMERRDWVHELTPDEIDEIGRALETARSRGKSFANLEVTDFPLPTLSKVLAEAQDRLEHGPGLYLLRGLPVLELPKGDSRLILWALGKHLGTAVPQSADGDVLGDVRDIGMDYRIYTSKRKGEFHTDSSDVVGLCVLRAAKAGGLTQVASSASIHNEILRTRPDLLDVLYQPFYWSWMNTQPPGEKPYFKDPIFSCWKKHFSCIYVAKLIQSAQGLPGVPPLSPQQIEAMHLLDSLAEDPRFHFAMKFEAGDLQLLNNHVCVHGRTEYEDHEDADQRRHLLRLWLSMPNSRDLDPSRGEFWNLRGGTVRGGFGRGRQPSFETTGEMQ